jgi:hypothetical protein
MLLPKRSSNCVQFCVVSNATARKSIHLRMIAAAWVLNIASGEGKAQSKIGVALPTFKLRGRGMARQQY